MLHQRPSRHRVPSLLRTQTSPRSCGRRRLIWWSLRIVRTRLPCRLRQQAFIACSRMSVTCKKRSIRDSPRLLRSCHRQRCLPLGRRAVPVPVTVGVRPPPQSPPLPPLPRLPLRLPLPQRRKPRRQELPLAPPWLTVEQPRVRLYLPPWPPPTDGLSGRVLPCPGIRR